MINREMRPVNLIAFAPGTDRLGQQRKIEKSSRVIDMVVKIQMQVNVNDVRYVDVTNIGLTADNKIEPGNQVIIDNEKYDVLYVIPSGRLHQVLMKKV